MKTHDPHLLFLILGLAAGIVAHPVEMFAQAPVGGQVKEFTAPVIDDQGRKTTTFFGKTGKPLPNGKWEISGMLVETFRGGEKYMIVEAPHCIFDPKSNVAFSPGALTVRQANGEFAIKGQGFRWQRADMHLMISNQVHTTIRLSGDTNKLAAALPADRNTAKTNTVEVDSDQFEHQSDLAIFRGNVRVQDKEGTLTCGFLKVIFEPAGGGAQRIEAEQNVILAQQDTRVTGDKAIYLMKESHLTFTGNPTWKVADKEGSGETIVIDNQSRAFRVDRKVWVKLLPDKMMPLDWFATPPPTNGPAQPPQPITITSDQFAYVTNQAVFRGHVLIADARGGTLSCGVLTNIFSDAEGKLTDLMAEEGVELKQGTTTARGNKATYRTFDQLVILTGNPSWKIDQGEGKGDLLILDPKTKKIRAEENVSMKLLGQTIATLDFSFTDSTTKTNSQNRGNQEVEIFSDLLQFKTGSAIFLKNVRLKDSVNVDREMTCEVLAAFFTEPDNKLDQIVAEENVTVRQGDLSARGAKVNYQVSKGLMEFSGHPELSTPARTYKADRFILDRVNNTFRMKGNYRIEMEREQVKQLRRSAATN